MHRFISLAAILIAALAFWPVPAQSDTAVTGAGAGLLSNSIWLYGITLQSLQFGQGVVILEDGSATGDFQSLLLGTSLLGKLLSLNVSGKARHGTVNADGSVTFDGTATVKLGTNTTLLTGVPFSVTTTTQGLQLRLDKAMLPLGKLTAGGITIE
jgi:hypothetical protein